ncbi:hypothetical protein J31TS4_38210 [Paenibacillus sp. J31TS4]|uniref:acyltransferase family protein n=1 Tax=Paenibacillus sp. J31TS4 TaxID=2807195 RepID=UPI001B198BCB|nr:acyltransferase [Paenibacillus sp. J31TS4]GIP40541.1 hypothetical protein J31TS4_38210 [Paenibacillus sp. J31TS4]
MQAQRTGHRLAYLDHLKVALTCLVVAHHAGQPYGGSNGFWYVHSGQEAIPLGAFFSVNAGFFMSLFFFISAYFLPASFDRKGPESFLKDRFKRLGLPLLFGFFVLVPALMYAYYLNFRGYGPLGLAEYYLQVYLGLGGRPDGWTGPSWPDLQFAHLWFLEHLLVYAVLYTVLRLVWKRSSDGTAPAGSPGTGAIVLFGTAVALTTFLVRTRYPIDHWVGFLGIVQTEFAHVPQYAAWFAAGAIAYRRQWLQTLRPAAGRAWLAVGLGLALVRYTGWLPLYSQGGWNGASIGYSFYETFLCLGLSIGLLYLFRGLGNRGGRLMQRLAALAFTVYVVHVPFVVCLQYLLEGRGLATWTVFAATTAGGILLSFAVSFLWNALLARIRARKTGSGLPVQPAPSR